jgi:hypothetical protein
MLQGNQRWERLQRKSQSANDAAPSGEGLEAMILIRKNEPRDIEISQRIAIIS